MATFSSLSQLDKLPAPVSKGREGVSPSPGFPVPLPANQDSRQTTLETNRKPNAYRAQMHIATQDHKYTHRYTCSRPMDTHMPMCAHSVHRGTLTLCSSGGAMQPFGSTHCDLFALEELWPQKGQTRQGCTMSPLPQQRPPQVETAQRGVEDAGARVGPCSCPVDLYPVVPEGGSWKGEPHLPFLSSFSIYPGQQVLGTKPPKDLQVSDCALS